MSSTVYLADKGRLDCESVPFDVSCLNSKLNYSFRKMDLTNIDRNHKAIAKSDKLWAATEKIFENQRRFMIATLFREVAPGQGISIRISGPFLEKLRAVYEDADALKLKIALQSGTKKWSIDVDLSSFKRQWGILRNVQSTKSEKLFRRVAALPGLTLTLKLTTKENALHTRRLLSRRLLEEKIPRDFDLIAENGARIAFHKELLAAHSSVFSCPTVQSLDAFQLFASEGTLEAFEDFVYNNIFDYSRRRQSVAFELLEMAHFYNITGLESVLKKKLLAAFPGFVDLDIALLLYCFAGKIGIGYEVLKSKAYNLIIRTPRSMIERSEGFKFIQSNDDKLATRIHNFGLPMNYIREA